MILAELPDLFYIQFTLWFDRKNYQIINLSIGKANKYQDEN